MEHTVIDLLLDEGRVAGGVAASLGCVPLRW
jgi:hypothetical protein